MQTAIPFSPPSLSVFKNHYLKKASNGDLIEKTPDDVFQRVEEFYVANGLDPAIAATMRDLQATKQFSFNSPVYYNADVENKHPQLLACFVGNLQDSMDSITDHVKRACTIFQSGAGLGFNIGSLRPHWASVGDGGKTKAGPSGSSGPLSFMGLFQAAGDTVMSAGKRRAAMWTGMRYDHPDAREFIKCKRGDEREKYTNMNISLIVDDEFTRMYEEDAVVEFNWIGLTDPWGSIKARELMKMIAESAWLGGDPGLMCVDVINRHNTTPTYGRIICFNPCVAGSTVVATVDGPKTIETLANSRVKSFDLYTGNGEPTKGTAFCTGVKPVYKVTFTDGRILECTKDHKLCTPDGKVPLGELEIGDTIITAPIKVDDINTNDAYESAVRKRLAAIRGWYAGDGGHSSGQFYLDFYDEKTELLGHIKEALWKLQGDEPNAVIVGNHARIHFGRIAHVFEEYEGNAEKYHIPQHYYGHAEYTKEYLSWLFSADGSVQGALDGHGVSIRLASSNLPHLRKVQLLLQYVGINSKIYPNRRDEGWRLLPDGKGSSDWYYCNADHELVVTRDNVPIFAEKIGFVLTRKMVKLLEIEKSRKRHPYRDKWTSAIKSVEYVGEEPVYDIAVDHDEHTFIANGLSISNCGEIALPPDTACNLGAVVIYNILRVLEAEGVIYREEDTQTFDWEKWDDKILDHINYVAKVGMAHLDKNIDVNHYPDELFAKNTKEIRPTGLGMSGLGEAFCALGVPYGSPEAIKIGAAIMSEITYAATEWSFDAAVSLGACDASRPAENAEAMKEQLLHYADRCKHYEIKGDKRWRKLAKRCTPGSYRNAYVTCIAPTGNTGIAFDAGSGGMEPIPAIAYQRNTRDGVLYFADQEFEIQVEPSSTTLEDIIDAFGGSVYHAMTFENVDAFMGSLTPATVDHLDHKYGTEDWRARIQRAWKSIDEYVSRRTVANFMMMHDIPWMDRIKQQEALQSFTALSISSTINVPQDTPVEEIQKIYLAAMASNHLKGITVYRDGSIQFAPMTMTKDTKDALPDTMPSQDTKEINTEMINSQEDTGKMKKVAATKAAKKDGIYPASAPGGNTEYGTIVVREKLERPSRTVGFTVELEFDDGITHDKFYVTVNEDPANPKSRPIEVFVAGGRHGENTPAMNQALGRLISGWLQDGAPVHSIAKKLIGIKGDHRASVFFHANEPPTRVLSIPDAIGKLLQREYLDSHQVISVPNGVMCPRCYHNTLVYGADGKKCWKCHNQDCGHYLC